jgi:thiamine pyrophosphate-dependent acetolactate synthase large subunit-like protein
VHRLEPSDPILPAAEQMGSPLLEDSERNRDSMSRSESTIEVALSNVLAELGVKTAFGLTGNSNLGLVTELISRHHVKFYTSRHESSAVSMADGWARTSGQVGVCTVTRGPGVTNAMTGLIEATRSRTPLLFLAGGVPSRQARSHNQRLDHKHVLSAAGIAWQDIRSPEWAAADLQLAFRRAAIEECPVAVELPPDLLSAKASSEASLAVWPEVHPATAASPPGIDELVRAVTVAKNPVVLVGRGGLRGKDPSAFVELADRTGAWLTTTAAAKGFFERSGLDLGVCGGFSTEFARSQLSQADVVLAFGASLNEWTTGHGKRFPLARIAQVDCDIRAFDRHSGVAIGVVGDAAQTAHALCAALEAKGTPVAHARSMKNRAAIGGHDLSTEVQDHSGPDGMDPRILMLALDKMLPRERTVVTDSGHFMGFPVTYVSVPDHKGLIFPQAFQSMGVGLGNAIGAATANPDRLTMAVLGDGGTMMTLGELDTAVRYDLPILILVMNDSAFGAEYHHLDLVNADIPDAIVFPDVDFAATARALGAKAITIRDSSDVQGIANWLGSRSGPLVVDAKITRRVRARWFEELWAPK